MIHLSYSQNAYNLLCRNFDLGMAECCHHERYLLFYEPMKVQHATCALHIGGSALCLCDLRKYHRKEI